jgi:hypothetical protein
VQAAGQVLVRTPERGPYRVVELIDRQSPLAVSNGRRLRPVPQTEFYTAGWGTGAGDWVLYDPAGRGADEYRHQYQCEPEIVTMASVPWCAVDFLSHMPHTCEGTLDTD